MNIKSHLIVTAYLRDQYKPLGRDLEGMIFKFYSEHTYIVEPTCYKFPEFRTFPDFSFTDFAEHFLVFKTLKSKEYIFRVINTNGIHKWVNLEKDQTVRIEMKRMDEFMRFILTIDDYTLVHSTSYVHPNAVSYLSISCVGTSMPTLDILGYSIVNSNVLSYRYR